MKPVNLESQKHENKVNRKQFFKEKLKQTAKGAKYDTTKTCAPCEKIACLKKIYN